MATARSAGARRLVSPTVKALMNRRSAELIGLALGLLGLAVLVALACYDPRDPSLNTATSRHVSNLAGPVGAVLADLLLQGFGVAGALPGLAMLAWAWRIASRRGLGSIAARVAALLAALPLLAAVLGRPRRADRARLAVGGGAGRGDRPAARYRRSRGRARHSGTARCLDGLDHRTALAVTLTLLALGLSAGEWRAASRSAGRAARYGVSGGSAASLALRGTFPPPSRAASAASATCCTCAGPSSQFRPGRPARFARCVPHCPSRG